MTVLDDLAARLSTELVDLAARPYSHAIVIPGDRGDRLVVDLQLSPGSYGDTTLFYVNLALCPVSWVAWLQESTLDQARALPPDHAEGLLRGRMDPLTFEPWWQATAGDLDGTLATLAPAVRAELTERWLPLLPRDALRQRLRSAGQLPGAGPSGKYAMIAQVLCTIDDMPAGDRAELVAYFRRRQADGDDDLGRLADWLKAAFPAGGAV